MSYFSFQSIAMKTSELETETLSAENRSVLVDLLRRKFHVHEIKGLRNSLRFHNEAKDF